MTYREVLDLAIKRVEKGWCQGCCACDDAGNVRPTTSGFATRWSLFGAVLSEHSRRSGTEPTLYDLIGEKLAAVGQSPAPSWRYELEEWNDVPGRTREEVLALLQNVRAELPP